MTPTLDEQIEWAEAIAETADEKFACPEVFHAILATLRAVKQAEPVAWRWERNGYFGFAEQRPTHPECVNITPLYAAPAAPQSPGREG